MGKSKIKHLGKNRKLKKKIKLIVKKTLIIISVIVCISALYNMTKELEESMIKTSEYDISEDKLRFIKEIEDGARYNYDKYGILPSITVAQAILESGWGQSKLTKDSNNIFGIKADSSWNGESIEVMTSENYNDNIKAKFRKYNNIVESIKDHGKFLSENKRYEENGLFNSKNYKKQAQALEDAGYSTKKDKHGRPIYADLLIDIIKKYSLTKLDFR